MERMVNEIIIIILNLLDKRTLDVCLGKRDGSREKKQNRKFVGLKSRFFFTFLSLDALSMHIFHRT